MFGNVKSETVVSIYEPIEFKVIDHNDLALELDVENLAKQAARENKPLTGSYSPDSNELKFKEDITKRAFQAGNKTKQTLTNLRDAISNTSITKMISEVEEINAKFEYEISTLYKSKIYLLENMVDEYRQSNDDINLFKKTNFIRRSANYPDSHILTFSLLIFSIIIESIINGIFFAEGSDAGLIGGVMIALIISFVNISVGFIAGFSLRYKNHINKAKVVFSYLVLLLLITFSCVFNLLIGHYREALEMDPDNAKSVAVERFTDGILTIYDVQSWLLIVIGLVFFSFAIYKGYKFDDEYPRYGKLCRNKEQLKEDINAEKDDICSVFDDKYEEINCKLDEIYENVQRISKSVNSYVNAKENQESIYHSYTVHLQSCLNYVVTLYREVNTNERSSEAPDYFKNIDLKLDSNENLLLIFKIRGIYL